jgi:hypothetical protein
MCDSFFQFNLLFLLQLVEVEFGLAFLWRNIFRINLCCQFFKKIYDNYLDDMQTDENPHPSSNFRLLYYKMKEVARNLTYSPLAISKLSSWMLGIS